MRRDLGDFQTPPELVAAVLDTLGLIGARWTRVLEPTCGRGHFLGELLRRPSPPREIQAIEIQPGHCRAAGERLAEHHDRGIRVTITCADVFQIDLGRDIRWERGGPLLVVGNPPWVTSAELGSLAGAQTPPKSNVKGLRGLEARTGASNFDVTEAVWLKLARDLAAEAPTIALLCKTAVARRILQFAHRAGLPVAEATIHRIDAARWFGAAVDACWFRVTLAGVGGGPTGGCAGKAGLTPATPEASSQNSGGWGRARRAKPPGNPPWSEDIPVYPTLASDEPSTVMGFSRGWLVADRAAYRHCAFADGICPATWRQGLKHDAADVMELAVDAAAGRLRDRSGRTVDVEEEFVYPLLKGADLKRPAADRPARAVLVTQRRIGDDTTNLADRAPKLWTYLRANAGRFERRRSSIYRGRPPFAVFGVGPYSFAPYKVAISGLHKVPVFRAVGPVDGRPVILDDTCYFLACSSGAEAVAMAALCNDPIALELLRSASFPDAKRPITKALLQRLDLRAILEWTDRRQLRSRAERLLVDELADLTPGRLPDILDRIDETFSGLRQDPLPAARASDP